MTDTDTAAEPGPPADVSAAALARYRTSMRRQRGRYFGVVGAIVVALLVLVWIAWIRGEVHNTRLHTVAHPPAAVAPQAPKPQPTQAWKTGDQAAIGAPLWRGTVVTYDRHTVRGRDARTGRQTWSYYRSNRTVCTAAQIAGTTVAVYAIGGNCDEVTGLDSNTGARDWTRTLDNNGQPLDGHPAYQATSDSLMMTTPAVIYDLNPDGGGNQFIYSRPGCRIEHAVLGSTGALISQTCPTVKCGSKKFCGKGPQLLLRDPYVDYNDDNGKNTANPDQIKWNRLHDTDIPVSADGLVTAFAPTARRLDAYNTGTGAAAGTVTLSPAPTGVTGSVAIPTVDRELVWANGRAYSLVPGEDTTEWSAPTIGAPSVTPPAGKAIAQLSTSRITAVTPDGVRVLDGTTGQATATITVATPPPGSRVLPLGAGLLVASPRGTVAYR